DEHFHVRRQFLQLGDQFGDAHGSGSVLVQSRHGDPRGPLVTQEPARARKCKGISEDSGDGLENPTELDLEGASITDADLKGLRSLNQLTRLGLNDTRGTTRPVNSGAL